MESVKQGKYTLTNGDVVELIVPTKKTMIAFDIVNAATKEHLGFITKNTLSKFSGDDVVGLIEDMVLPF